MNTRSFSVTQLKLIAIIAMVIDHIGAVFYPDIALLRIIGRLTMPIMAFFIAEGYFYTKNLRAYMQRLLIFGLITMYPYALYFGYGPYNIMFSLLAGLMAIAFYDRSTNAFTRTASLLIPMLIATFMQFDGQFITVFLIYIFYRHRGHFKLAATQMFMLYAIVEMMIYLTAVTTNSLDFHAFIQPFALFSLPLLSRYRGELGGITLPKYTFYIFYPLHISILLVIKTFL